MFDHVTISVSNLQRAKDFYATALAPLGITCVFEGDGYCGFGVTRPTFWLGLDEKRTSKVHVAFTAKSQDDVKAFYEAALAAGGTDNGTPGLRPEYHDNYFGAFILDPDGNNVEAVYGND